MQGFGLEFSELREYTHGFFSNVAEILDDGFIKVEILCSSIKLSPALSSRSYTHFGVYVLNSIFLMLCP